MSFIDSRASCLANKPLQPDRRVEHQQRGIRVTKAGAAPEYQRRKNGRRHHRVNERPGQRPILAISSADSYTEKDQQEKRSVARI